MTFNQNNSTNSAIRNQIAKRNVYNRLPSDAQSPSDRIEDKKVPSRKALLQRMHDMIKEQSSDRKDTPGKKSTPGEKVTLVNKEKAIPDADGFTTLAEQDPAKTTTDTATPSCPTFSDTDGLLVVHRTKVSCMPSLRAFYVSTNALNPGVERRSTVLQEPASNTKRPYRHRRRHEHRQSHSHHASCRGQGAQKPPSNPRHRRNLESLNPPAPRSDVHQVRWQYCCCR